MAKHPDLLGISVDIRIDNCTAREYDTTIGDGKYNKKRFARTMSNYIEAKTGKEFAVDLGMMKADGLDCAALSFQTFVDGTRMSGRTVTREQLKDKKVWINTVRGSRKADETGAIVLRPFTFSAIATSMYTQSKHLSCGLELTLHSR